MKILVADVMARVVDRLKRRPRPVGEAGNHLKGGILPEKLGSVEFLKLQAEGLSDKALSPQNRITRRRLRKRSPINLCGSACNRFPEINCSLTDLEGFEDIAPEHVYRPIDPAV